MILKPFMLRRVKKDVENELGDKVKYYRLFTVLQLMLFTAVSFLQNPVIIKM